MDDAAGRQDWNALGLNAVHTVISAADALTVFFLGERSSGDSHQDVVELLRRLPFGDESRAKARQASEVIQVKNAVEYEDVDFEENEAMRCDARARRFHDWARSKLRER